MRFNKSSFNIFKAGVGHVGTPGLGFFTKGVEGGSHLVAGTLGYGVGPLLGAGVGLWMGSTFGPGAGAVGAALGAGIGFSLGAKSMRKWSRAFMGTGDSGTGFFHGITESKNELLGKFYRTPAGKVIQEELKYGMEGIDNLQKKNFRVMGMRLFPYKNLPKNDIRRYAPHAGLAVGLSIGKAVFGPAKEFGNMVLNNNRAPDPTTTYDNLMREITSAQNLGNSLRR